jgi:hypothetical protein
LIESSLVALLLILLGVGAVAPWPWLLQAGALLALAGLAVGLPAGFVYHVRLRRWLIRHGALVRGWWVQPVRLHRHLDEPERRDIGGPFRLGAGGMVLSLVGCALVLLGVIRSLGDAPP